MKKLFFQVAALLFCVTSGVYAAEFSGYKTGNESVLPAEDIDVLTRYSDLIGVLKDPKIKPASEEKYNAAKELLDHVDVTFVRETKTLDQLFYHGDAIYDYPNAPDRTITFYYEWKDHSIRIVFHTYTKFVLRVDVHRQ